MFFIGRRNQRRTEVPILIRLDAQPVLMYFSTCCRILRVFNENFVLAGYRDRRKHYMQSVKCNIHFLETFLALCNVFNLKSDMIAQKWIP